MTDTPRTVIAAHQAAAALQRAAAHDVTTGITPTADGSDVLLTSADVRSLTRALNAFRVDTHVPAGILRTHATEQGATLPVGKAWALVRSLGDVSRADRRQRDLARGIVRGPLSGREAAQLALRLGRR